MWHTDEKSTEISPEGQIYFCDAETVLVISGAVPNILFIILFGLNRRLNSAVVFS